MDGRSTNAGKNVAIGRTVPTLYLRSNRRNFIVVCWTFAGVAALMCFYAGVGLIQHPASSEPEAGSPTRRCGACHSNRSNKRRTSEAADAVDPPKLARPSISRMNPQR